MAWYTEGLQIGPAIPDDVILAQTPAQIAGTLGFRVILTGKSLIECVLQVLNADGSSVDATLAYIYQPATPVQLGPFGYAFTLNQKLQLLMPGWGGPDGGQGNYAFGAIVTTLNF